MVVRSITVGRTYNTGAYTSRRFDLTVELADDDSLTDAYRAASKLLHECACTVMREDGLDSITEPTGLKYLDKDQADDDAIPF